MVITAQDPTSDVEYGTIRPRRVRNLLMAAGVIALLVLGVSMIALALAVGLVDRASGDRSVGGPGGVLPAPVVVADRPVDGKIAFTIPLGAADAQFSGGEPYVMPSVIRLRVGDSVVVANNDVYPHMILNALTPAGETTTITFDEPGAQAFSSGCTANGGTMNSFTSVIVSERG
jgi:hypothetical protein